MVVSGVAQCIAVVAAAAASAAAVVVDRKGLLKALPLPADHKFPETDPAAEETVADIGEQEQKLAAV